MDILSAAVHSPDFQSKLAALLLTALAGWFLQRLWPAERVVWGTSHGFSFSIPQKDAALSLLDTRSFYIRNTGRESATGLEVISVSSPSTSKSGLRSTTSPT
jgi:hypothetical protein